jgi:hypothetical protein
MTHDVETKKIHALMRHHGRLTVSVVLGDVGPFNAERQTRSGSSGGERRRRGGRVTLTSGCHSIGYIGHMGCHQLNVLTIPY